MAAIDKRKAVQAALDYTRQRRFDRAIAEYKNALSVDPQDLTVWKKLGDLYVQTGAVQEAIATYMKLGELYRADGLAAKAIAIYRMVLDLDPKNMQIHLACADLYAEQGLVGEARIRYMTAAEHYTRGGETQKALEVFEKLANLDPSNFSVAAKVGEMYEKEKMPAQAAGHYLTAAQAAARAGQVKEAGDLYGRALRLRPEAPEALLGLGRLHLEAGNYGEAAATLERAAAAAPDDTAPLVLLARCYRNLQDPGRAIQVLRRAVEGDPRATELRLDLARCLAAAGRVGEAWEAYAAAADCLVEQGEGAEAVALLEGLSGDAFPEAALLEKLAELHRRLGQEDAALEKQRRLAERHELEGRPEAARAVYRALLEALPDDPEIAARLRALEGTEPAGGPQEGGGEDTVSFAGADLLPEGPEAREAPALAAAPAGEPDREEVPVLAAAEEGIGLFPGEEQAAPAEPEAEEDAAEVAEQLAEAEVYLKYGLVEKAAERLRETLVEFPQNVAARVRLRRLYLDEGRSADAATETVALAEVLAARGQGGRAVRELEQLLAADPENAAVAERLERLRGGEAPAGVAAGPGGLVPSPEAPEVEPEGIAPPPPGPAEAAEPVEAAEPLAGPAETEPQDILDFGSLLGLEGPPAEPLAEPAAEGEALSLDLEAEPLRLELGREAGPAEVSLDLREAVGEEALQALGFAPEPSPEAEGSPLAVSLGAGDEELDEADFFRAQGMAAEAEALYRRILEGDPDNARARAGLAALQAEAAPPAEPREEPSGDAEAWIPGPAPFEAPAEPETTGPAPAPPAAPESPGPDVDLEDLDLPAPPGDVEGAVSLEPLELEGLGALETAPPPVPEEARPAAEPPPGWRVAGEEAPAAAPPPSAEPPAPPAAAPRRIGPAEEVPVFRVAEPTGEAAPGGFVDLGAEIQREIDVAGRGPLGPVEGAALLDDLLQEFQKGVREHLDVEDYETHYNLGIAYREMGLHDEAISAFRLAAKDPTRRLTCEGLVALCLVAKGRPEAALQELEAALAIPGYAPEQYHALRYDVATALEAAGQEGLALGLLEALAGAAPGYRDAAKRLAALRARQAKEPAGPPPGEEAIPAEAPPQKPSRPRRDKISFV